MGPDDVSRWNDAIQAAIARAALTIIDRVAILTEASSTQDAARSMAAGRPGLALLADRQTSGRGRLGRAWDQGAGAGLAMTLALDSARWPAEHVSLAAGVAAAETIAALLPETPIGLRWPNDVVERRGGRKVAGVLVERASGLLLLGIGVNVAQGETDWPPDLRGRAASIRALGGAATRIDVACALVETLEKALAESPAAAARRWCDRDVLTGRAAAFTHDGRRYEGVVEGIDPASAIMLRAANREVIRLPALTTSLVHPG